MRGASSPKQRKVKDHAFTPNSRSSGCCRRSPVGGKPIHPNAGIHQIHSEWRRSHRRGSVAAEYLWSVPFAGQGSCRRTPELVEEPATCTPTFAFRNTADLLPQGDTVKTKLFL